MLEGWSGARAGMGLLSYYFKQNDEGRPTNEMAFGGRPEGTDGASYGDISGNIPSRVHSKCKDTEAGNCSEYVRDFEASKAGVQQMK